MEIGLEYAIGAVHRAEGPDVQDLVPTTGIPTGTRAFADKRAPVFGQIEDLLGVCEGIVGFGYPPEKGSVVVNGSGRQPKPGLDSQRFGTMGDTSMDIQLRDRQRGNVPFRS